MAIVLALACLFVYLRMHSDLNAGVDTSVQSRSDLAVALVERSGADALGETRLAEPEEGFAQVLSPAGAVLGTTAGSTRPSLTPAEAARAATGDRLRVERRVQGVEGKVRILARRATTDGERVVVAAGSSLDDRDETLALLLRSFAIGGAVAVLLASALGVALARAGLAPVEQMRQRAQRISLDQPGERLPLPPADDEIRRLGETLNEMLARLEASFERERRFVADAGHELRTPLTVLKAEIETALRTTPASDERHDALAAALAEVDHLAQLADDLLTVARPGAEGRLPLQRELLDVRDQLEAALARFAQRAEAEGRQIVVDVPNGLSVDADPLRLRQALGNLIDNALRYGAGQVRLRAHEIAGFVEIEVADEGDGFPPALADHAFDRFTRGDGTRTRDGAGLGLAIVRAIAEAHGGSASLGRQTATITIRLPTLTSISSSPHTVQA